MRFEILILAFFSLPLTACSQSRSSKPVIQKRKTSKATVFRGVATYYHEKFHGKRMSNGGIYSKYKLSAASNRIPLNKWIRVTNLRNKLSVIVKITDRMHPKNKLLLDLSLAAAKKINMISDGRTLVKVQILDNYHPLRTN